MQIKVKRLGHFGAVAGLAVAVLLPAVLASRAQAATLTSALVRFDRMQTSTATTGTVCIRPATTSANVKTWTVTFPTGYTVSTTAANWQTANISTTNLAWPTGAVAWPNATSATAVAVGQTVTWTNASVQNMSNASTYCYNWTNSAALSIAASATSSNVGSVATQDNVAATIDSGSYSTASVSSDQITVSATVPQSFSFSLSATTDNLGTLTTGAVAHSPTPRTATVNTNAKNGWQVWARDASTGLNSTTASKTISSLTPGSNSTVTSGSEGYNTGVTSAQTSGSGTISVSAVFDGTTLSNGGGLDTTLRSVATSNGTANNAVLTLTNNAAISSITPSATDYTDVITIVGAGLF
jgi:hypothetical protein